MDIAYLEADRKTFHDSPNVYWEVVPHPIEPASGKQVAKLIKVAWLDVAAAFSNCTAGSYQVQWKLNYDGVNPDSVFVGTTFQAI
ncbi:hypothetical protein BGX34_003822, partial [Mortierella sp. NVP85]